jgi:hypothetical protein
LANTTAPFGAERFAEQDAIYASDEPHERLRLVHRHAADRLGALIPSA